MAENSGGPHCLAYGVTTNHVLGMEVAARHPTMPMTFYTLGNHHDLALLEVGDDAPQADRKSTGLYHLAFCVGDTLDELRAVRFVPLLEGLGKDG